MFNWKISMYVGDYAEINKVATYINQYKYFCVIYKFWSFYPSIKEHQSCGIFMIVFFRGRYI